MADEEGPAGPEAAAHGVWAPPAQAATASSVLVAAWKRRARTGAARLLGGPQGGRGSAAPVLPTGPDRQRRPHLTREPREKEWPWGPRSRGPWGGGSPRRRPCPTALASEPGEGFLSFNGKRRAGRKTRQIHLRESKAERDTGTPVTLSPLLEPREETL